MDAIMERRRKLNNANVVSSDEQDGEEANEEPTTEEVDSVRPHPEDQHFYPDEYQRWRYMLGGSDAESTKQPQNWRSFHLLSKRQQHAVKTKLAPKINHIVWTRWPDARVVHLPPKDDTNQPIV